jgi:catechol 2,3-dioxygenase-like lactoylglutathione lyase family enzyme
VIDHLGFRVRNLAAARRFYEAVARALGLAVADNTPESFVFGRSAQKPVPFLWVGTTSPAFWTEDHRTSQSPIHVAFTATSREAVNEFHRSALAAGGRDNGAPGPRGPAELNYYAAFVLDPDGNNIEAGFRAKT